MSDRNSDGPGFYLLPADEDLVVSGDEHGSYTLWRARTGGWRYPVAASPSLGTIRAAMRLLGASDKADASPTNDAP